MRIKGKKIKGINVKTLVFPRGDNIEDALVFRVRAVTDYSEFEALCPEPKPAIKIMAGGDRVADTDQPDYKKALADYNEKRWNWMIAQSIQATEELEFEHFDFNNPKTWNDLDKEFEDADITQFEFARITAAVLEVNALDEEKLDEARDAFLALARRQREALSSQNTATENTESGELVNDSDSDPQE